MKYSQGGGFVTFLVRLPTTAENREAGPQRIGRRRALGPDSAAEAKSKPSGRAPCPTLSSGNGTPQRFRLQRTCEDCRDAHSWLEETCVRT